MNGPDDLCGHPNLIIVPVCIFMVRDFIDQTLTSSSDVDGIEVPEGIKRHLNEL